MHVIHSHTGHLIVYITLNHKILVDALESHMLYLRDGESGLELMYLTDMPQNRAKGPTSKLVTEAANKFRGSGNTGCHDS